MLRHAASSNKLHTELHCRIYYYLEAVKFSHIIHGLQECGWCALRRLLLRRITSIWLQIFITFWSRLTGPVRAPAASAHVFKAHTAPWWRREATAVNQCLCSACSLLLWESLLYLEDESYQQCNVFRKIHEYTELSKMPPSICVS